MIDGVELDAHRGRVDIDLESTSAVEIGDAGAWAYSLHWSTRIYCVCWRYVGDHGGATKVQRWEPGDPVPAELVAFVRAGGTLLAHNAGFEQAMWANILVPRHDWPFAELDQWRDSCAVGLQLSLPQKLEGLAKMLGAPVQKDDEGHRLMLKMARLKVTDGVASCKFDTPANRDRLARYCADDVLAMGGAYVRAKAMPLQEHRAWLLHQKINARGVYLDRERAARIRRMAERRLLTLSDEASRLSQLELADAADARALKEWLERRGVELPMVTRKRKDGFATTASTDKNAVAEILARHDLDPVVRAVLENRVEATKGTSLAKLQRVETMTDDTGRLRGALTFQAAHTGRWSSSGLQLHNLPKDKLDDQLGEGAGDVVDQCIEADDLDALVFFTDRPLAALSQKLRSVVAAPPGRELIAADFSGIEARVCAWLAEQEDKLAFLFNFDVERAAWLRGERDTKPIDLYQFAAASIGSDSRQLGKVAELALQYGMGDLKFADTAVKARVMLTLLEARKVKKAWRETNACIVRFWKDCEDAARSVIERRGTAVDVGRLRFWSGDNAMYVDLPSGRTLYYWKPTVRPAVKKIKTVDDEGKVVEIEMETSEIRFLTQNPAKNGMRMESTYDGKLVENFTQAVARDLLRDALHRLEDNGYPVVMHVHDSAACEVAEGTGDVAEFSAIMAEVPVWAKGCPVAVDGYRARRFRG